MSHRRAHRPVFGERFDVVVYGGGHAGFAAALQSARDGYDTLLIDRRGDLLSEPGRVFAVDAGTDPGPVWQELQSRVSALGGAAGGWLDGALTECCGTAMLRESAATSLYYATALGVDLDDDGLVSSVLLATRAGLRQVSGGRWIDATSTADLARILDPGLVPRRASRSRRWMYLQHPDWDAVPGAAGLPTAWQSERAFELPAGTGPDASDALLAGLHLLGSAIGATELARTCLSHFSFAPFDEFGAVDDTDLALPPNLVTASPGLSPLQTTTLADLHRLGLRAATTVIEGPFSVPQRVAAARHWAPERTSSTQVAVIGAGTGGVLAAVAAARSGADVHAVEASDLVGGVGTVGGIHVYWFGAPGGLQAELDELTRDLMRSFENGPLSDGPFNPWAKLVAAERMVRDSGARLTRQATVYGVERDGDRIVAALCATPDGILRIEAEAFIDATGDGDLCALADVPFRLGRESDGLLHAFSQSSGRVRSLRGEPRMDTVNFDAGFCDPTDPTDLTRARQEGIANYLIDCRFDEFERPTYLAPALGIRQGRQVETDLVLQLDDLVSRRRFADAVGYTAAHFDNHATDMQFENVEAAFYQWVLEQSTTPIGCELSYRQLLPVGLSNVWIGSRCLGLSQEAQYVTRMQRDIQRIGEVAGLAAALAVNSHTQARSVDISTLQDHLRSSGALGVRPRSVASTFGLYQRLADDGRVQFRPEQATDGGVLRELGTGAARQPGRQEVAAALDSGRPDASLWWALHHRDECEDLVVARLGSPTASDGTTWLAAAVTAMWGEADAEPRLIAAIERLEPSTGRRHPRPQNEGSEAGPGKSGRAAPRWLAAVVLLRRCGTAACVPVLTALAQRPAHSVDVLSAMALTTADLAGRLTTPEQRAGLRRLVELLEAVPPLATVDYAARNVGAQAHEAALSGRAAPDHATANGITGAYGAQLRSTYQDRTWQLEIALLDARRSLGMPVAVPASLVESPIAVVRRAARRRVPARE